MSERVLVRFHTSRKPYRCASKTASACTGRIEPGDRYAVSSLPPGHDAGYERWLTIRACAPCAAAYGYREVKAEGGAA